MGLGAQAASLETISGYFKDIETLIYVFELMQKNCRFNTCVTMTPIKRRKRQKFVYCFFRMQKCYGNVCVSSIVWTSAGFRLSV